MESFALKHFIYSTPFNQLFKGKINAKRRRIVKILLGFNWLLIFLIFSKMVPILKDIVPPYKVNFFSVMNQDRNSYIIIAVAHLTTIYYMKTDFLINESSSYMLFDMNLLKNRFSNRLNEKNEQKLKIKSEFLYRILNVTMLQLGKVISTLFFTISLVMILSKVHNIILIDAAFLSIICFIGFMELLM